MEDKAEGEGRRGWESCRIWVRRNEDLTSMIVGGGIMILVTICCVVVGFVLWSLR